MKNTKLIFSLLAVMSLGLTAQNKYTKKADTKFNRLEFVSAIEEYKKVIEKGHGDTYVFAQLADSYYNIFSTVEAEEFYAKVLENSEDSEYMYRYSQMLKANGKYDQSNEWMGKFSAKVPEDNRAIAFRKNPTYINKILDKGQRFNIQNADFNSEYSDFGGSLQGRQLYFTSARNTSRKSYGWNDQPFLDIYTVAKNEDGTYNKAKTVGSPVNSKYHDADVSFSPDGKTVYFSRESFFENSFEKSKSNKLGVVHLFKATKDGLKWSNVEGFSINNSKYSLKNPSVSADGKFLYYASDMPGGFGGFDLYRSAITDEGLGTPENLGQKVNTEGQEMFPFMSSNGTLYFSSNGHLGMGGLDIFFTKLVDDKYTPVRNLGIPANSNGDDFAFSIDESTGEGFVSSNRAGGKGSDDIYYVKSLKPICDVLVSVVVDNSENGNLVSEAVVSMTDDQGNVMGTKNTSSEGLVEYMISCDAPTFIEVIAEGYESTKINIPGASEEEVSVSVSLKPIEDIIQAGKVVLNPIYFDFDKSNVTKQAAFELDKLVQLMKKYPKMGIAITSHTDKRGRASYNLKLSDRRAKTTAQYLISQGIDSSRVKAEGKGETEQIIDCAKVICSKEDYEKNRRSEFTIIDLSKQ